MQTRMVGTRSLIVVALGACLLAGRAITTQPLALARSNPTAGTITVTARETAVNGGDTRTATCQYTVSIVSSTEVDITIKKATYVEINKQTNPDGTTRTVTTRLKVDPTQTSYKEGSQYLPTISTSNEDAHVPAGDYGLQYYLPPSILSVTGKEIITQTNQPTQTYPTQRRLFCPTRAPHDGDELLGRLTGSATIRGRQLIQWDWAGIGGIPGGQISWKLTDPALQTTAPKPTNPPNKPLPTGGQIKVTNNGIEATLKWKDFEIGYAGDWKAKQDKPGTPPTISSPSQKVQITINELPAGGRAPAATAQQVIRSSGKTPAGATGVTAKPFAVGPLTGVMDTFTAKGSPDTWVVVVVGNGQIQITMLLDLKPNTPPQEILEAGVAIGSLRLAT